MNIRHNGIAIVINLDYQNLSHELGQVLWSEIEKAMLAAGFARDNRVFVAYGDPLANDRAKTVLRRLEPVFDSFGVCQLDAIHEFYSYPLDGAVNLLLSGSGFELHEMAA